MSGSRELIIIVDDNLANLQAGKDALSDTYKVLTIASASKLLEMVGRFSPALILLDVEMPEMNGYDAIKILKTQPETKNIPVIFLTGMTDAASEITGLDLGAVDYIVKPFSAPLLHKRIELHLLLEAQRRKLLDYANNLESMVETKTKTVLKLQNKILQAMSELVEGRDDVTGNHIERTIHCLNILLNEVKITEKYRVQVESWDVGLILRSSQLHDIGKIGISDSILKKPAKLTDDEFEAMKQHVDIGVRFIEKLDDGEADINFLRYAKMFAEFHHEKWNGTGYPKGLAGADIPLLGRLMAIADVYEALTSVRPYKRAFSHKEASKIIVESSGTHFDPELVKLFENVADRFQTSPKADSDLPEGGK
ncbi:MAG: response regulator [Deltaproteobacteria bacterium]|jgi:putative two-component system response regulator|nr:response regulator [Deltaproteobacteria bacterium]